MAMLASTTALSQFFRSSTAVIAPELIRDLDLSSATLGFANGSFFMAVLLGQIPVGLAFDRFGVRRTVAALSLPMAIGAMLHGLADTGSGLAAARFLVGIGSAASYTAGVVMISRWFARPDWSTLISWQFALGQIGLVLAGTPLAAAVAIVGWRFPFVVMGTVALLIGYLFLNIVRDAPPGAEPDDRDAPNEVGALEGIFQVLTTPGTLQVLCLYMVTFASMTTVLVVWAGPYLHDVHNLDTLERGNVILGMALAQTAGVLAVGPLDRLFNTRKWVSVGSGSLALAAMIGLALGPLSRSLAVFFLLLLSATTAYGGVLFAQMRSLFPAHLAGRSATITNMAPLLGASVLPTLTGLIPPLFPHQGVGYAPLAYQAIFAVLACCLAAGLAIYLTARDSKPRQSESPGSSVRAA
jgi:MFS family permease